mmetsp:Transcript_6853/g.18954  ORF Transcript_6853/g.18954 Transcript_6853/m.18954 type:complete len:155 (-) Transcript_6853:30-494(-)
MAETNGARLDQARTFFNERCKPNFAHIEGIDAAEVARLMQEPDPPILVDARSDLERSVSMVKGAVVSDVESLSKETRPIVVYCGIGGRSGNMCAKILEANPAAQVKNFELSMIGWCHFGGDLVDTVSKEPTNRVHAFNETFKEMYPVGGFDVVV